MNSKRELARLLADLEGFREPRVALEQYATPARLAADLVHLADLQGDVAGRTVVDLGTGTGILALAAALRGAGRVVGVERDDAALAVARENAARLDLRGAVGWLRADATRPPICPTCPVTVVANPPFGAQRGNVHADRAFLNAAIDLAAVSYTVHNAGSRDFVEAFAADEGGTVTHAFRAPLSLDRQFPFHDDDCRDVQVEVYRIAWAG